MRVFIVDDDADFAESLAMALEGHGHTVSLAGSGEEAVRRFHEEDFDIAFMDVRLPGRNGVESFLEIRSFKPRARVVMMTGYRVTELLAQATANGAYAVLEKPLDPRQVVEIVERLDSGLVLLADDDPDFLASLREALEARHIRVVSCRDGAEALELAAVHDPDAVVLDLRMPLLDGMATYRALRERGLRVPTLIVTAYADEEQDSMASLRALSIDGILRKPFDVEALIGTLDRLMHAPRPAGD